MATTAWNSHLNMLLNEIQNVIVQVLAADPSGTAGRIYYNSTDGSLRWYDGVNTTWQTAAGGGGYTDEQVRDVIGAALVAGTNIDITVNDAGDTITIDVEALTSADISDFDTQVRTSRLDQMAAPTAAVSMNSQKITNLADGTDPGDAVSFGQFNGVLQGQSWKAPVRAATTANVTLSGEQTIDGVSVVTGDRVLVKAQTAAEDDGIYVADSGAWARAADANTAAEVNNATVLIEEGTAGAGDIYTQTATVTTLGTDAQTWTKVGEGNTVYQAGDGLDLTGNTFDVDSTVARVFTDTWTGAGTTKTVTHNLGKQFVTVAVYDDNDVKLEGIQVTATSATQLDLAVNTAPDTDTWNIVVVG